jgi:hypothetical protein
MTQDRVRQYRKGEMVREARERTRRLLARCGQADQPVAGHCVAVSSFLETLLRAEGLPAVLQAGTCYWPCEGGPGPDGRVGAFGYHWHDGADWLARVRDGMLPELHAWVAVRGTEADNSDCTVIDPLAGFLPEQCRKIQGLPWTAPAPPDFLWCRPGELPDGVVYLAARQACVVAAAFARALRHGGPLVIPMNRERQAPPP